MGNSSHSQQRLLLEDRDLSSPQRNPRKIPMRRRRSCKIRLVDNRRHRHSSCRSRHHHHLTRRCWNTATHNLFLFPRLPDPSTHWGGTGHIGHVRRCNKSPRPRDNRYCRCCSEKSTDRNSRLFPCLTRPGLCSRLETPDQGRARKRQMHCWRSCKSHQIDKVWKSRSCCRSWLSHWQTVRNDLDSQLFRSLLDHASDLSSPHGNPRKILMCRRRSCKIRHMDSRRRHHS